MPNLLTCTGNELRYFIRYLDIPWERLKCIAIACIIHFMDFEVVASDYIFLARLISCLSILLFSLPRQLTCAVCS